MPLSKDIKQARPFVKWAGGKTQLLEEVEKALPRDIASRRHLTYVEPFVGGGAVLFWILQRYSNFETAVINDVNPELINTYRIIKEQVEELIAALSAAQNEYIPMSAEGRKDYFRSKRALFNSRETTPVEAAALFIFLNRTCFNGLYRVNSKGEFNVPHGKYANPRICDEDNLRAVSAVLQKVEILCGDFSQTGDYSGPDTVYYIDPPYKPITDTSAFTSYAIGGFDDAEQLRLRDFCDRISAGGSLFVESNSDPRGVNPEEDFFDDIYSDFSIKRVAASRMINSNPSGRGSISELMITNIINA